MSPRLLPLTAFVLCALGMQATAQRFVGLPVGSSANDVTADGRIVVGAWDYDESFIWDWRNDPEPTIVSGGTMVAVSDDGTVVAGNAFDASVGAFVAAIWTQAGGWQILDWLPTAPCGPLDYSTAYDISGDGTTVVGLGWDGCNPVGFRWTEATGMQALQSLANGVNRCSAISGDGSTLGGFAQGNFDRTPAYWDATTAGFVIDPNDIGEVYGLNEDGSKSVGEINGSAFVRDAQTGVITDLGSLNGGSWIGRGQDISEDGNVIVGDDFMGLANEAWLWRNGEGIISMNDRLAALGITGVPDLWVCHALSDDGNVVVGGGFGATGGPFGFAGYIVSFLDPAQFSFRNAGANPVSYTADPPVVGANWMATVDLSTTGHSSAVVFGFDTPLAVTLGGGQVLLTAGAYAFDLPSMTGPMAVWNTPVANDPALVGQKISTQAIHFGGVIPYSLSNAQDLTLGF